MVVSETNGSIMFHALLAEDMPDEGLAREAFVEEG